MEITKVTQPLTKAIYEKGYSLRGLYRKARREGINCNLSTFEAVAYGRMSGTDTTRDIEAWFKKNGLGKELKEAQANYQKELADIESEKAREAGNG